MWVRSTATVPSPTGVVVEALGRLTPDTLATLAQAASNDGCHLSAHLGRPVRRDEITTIHLRWWNDRARSLTPGIDGELELRPLDTQSTEVAITAQYRCREALRELHEETGYQLAPQGSLISLGYYFSSPGFTDEHCYFFLARPVQKSAERQEHDAGEAILVERALHDSFFAEFGLTAHQVWSTPLAPTNLAYTRYLLAAAYGQPFHEVLAALLPCYWVYWEVGKELELRGSSDPLYQRWIDTYASEAFGSSVQPVIGLTNTVALALNAQQRATMRAHFIATTRYEWMFWDMGYRKEAWPV